MENTDEISAFEVILFMFDLIVNADQVEKTFSSLQKLMEMFESMVGKDKAKARPVLSTHLMTCLLEASDN